VLHNNLAVVTWQFEGPGAALAACEEGIDFCERRGIAEFALIIAGMGANMLGELGRTEDALDKAGPVAQQLEAAGNIYFSESRGVQLSLRAERRQHQDVAGVTDFVAVARESDPQMGVQALSAGARALLAQGHRTQAKSLLVQLAHLPEVDAEPNYAATLPALVRAAFSLGEPELAARLTDGVTAVTPIFEHAICAARAALAEAAGDHSQAVGLYADAAERWRVFGNVPERAYALLGQGRCLTEIRAPEAEQPLLEARDLFAAMGYQPALAETEALLSGPGTIIYG
jgi:tetratricopeptide (TPR) repeat protein